MSSPAGPTAATAFTAPAADVLPHDLLRLLGCDPGRQSGRELVDLVVAAERLAGWAQARSNELMAALAVPGVPGPTAQLGHRIRHPEADLDDLDTEDEVAAAMEWEAAGRLAADQLAAVLVQSPITMRIRVNQAQTMVHDFTTTHAALGQGRLCRSKAAVVVDRLQFVADPEIRQQLEERAADAAGGRAPGRLGALLDRWVMAADPAAAERRRKAARVGRKVTHRPLADGMGRLSAGLPADASLTIHALLTEAGRVTQGLTGADDTRTLDQCRADLLSDIMLTLAAGESVTLAALLEAAAEAAQKNGEAPDEGDCSDEGSSISRPGDDFGEGRRASTSGDSTDEGSSAGRPGDISDERGGATTSGGSVAKSGDSIGEGSDAARPDANSDEGDRASKPDDNTDEGDRSDTADELLGKARTSDNTDELLDNADDVEQGRESGDCTGDVLGEEPADRARPTGALPDDPPGGGERPRGGEIVGGGGPVDGDLSDFQLGVGRFTLPKRQGRPLHTVVTLTLDALAGLSSDPASLSGYGTITAEWARLLSAAASKVSLLIVDQQGHALGASAWVYRPSQQVRDQVVTMNPTCAFGTCSRPAVACQLDHRRPFCRHNPTAGGPTTLENLQPLCPRHHQAKTHGGWQIEQAPDGTRTFISPLGIRTSVPPADHPVTPPAAAEDPPF